MTSFSQYIGLLKSVMLEAISGMLWEFINENTMNFKTGRRKTRKLVEQYRDNYAVSVRSETMLSCQTVEIIVNEVLYKSL
jgi:hypothetical protein